MESPSCQGRNANYAETATTLGFLDCMSHEEVIHESKILPLYHPAAWPLGSLASEEEVAPSLGITRRIAASSSTPVAPHRVSGCMTRHFTRSRSSKTWSLRSQCPSMPEGPCGTSSGASAHPHHLCKVLTCSWTLH